MLCSYLWAAAGKQPSLEDHIGVGGHGYPALVALNLKKKAFAPLRSAFEHKELFLSFSSCFGCFFFIHVRLLREFVKEAGHGGKGNLPLQGSPTILKSEPWDGRDGEVFEEDEFSLDELMAGLNDSKDS